MNERLKFSWGHIIAFVALIAVSYLTFMGCTYLTNGDFTIALIAMGIVDVTFILIFIGAQQLKASGVHMSRKIKFERALIFLSPIVFIIGMIPAFHFWTVYSHNDEIVGTFKTSINNAKELFADYEKYSENRIYNYDKALNLIIGRQYSDPQTFARAGFVNGKADIQKENMVQTLRLQLLSSNSDSLKNVAIKWIDRASYGASTWNVFLLGNTQEIKSALADWEKQLKGFSDNLLSNEDLCIDVIDFQSAGVNKAIAGIDSMTTSFTKMKSPSLYSILIAVLLYFMLLFPYLLQERHTKSVYRPWSFIKFDAVKGNSDKSNIDKSDVTTSTQTSNNDDDYPSF